MGDYVPQRGHRVRGTRTREGVVTERGDNYVMLDDRRHVALYDEHGWTWERLPDLEPDWWPPKLGDVAVEGDDEPDVLFRVTSAIGDEAWTNANGVRVGDAEAARPLTLLVRDGKPVTDGA